MPISTATLANYAPWGNATLAFDLAVGDLTTNPATGNVTQATEVVEYLAALTLEAPQWSDRPGTDETIYACRGRLLQPAVLDARITNGAQAAAVINGARGRFELVFDLVMDTYHRQTLRQSIQGRFRVIGGI